MPSRDQQISSIEPTVSFQHVRKSYRGHVVLSDLCMTVKPGGVYALVGRNGAGKSTTFKILLGLIRPDAGEVRLFGQPWERRQLDRVGASVDGPALYNHLSASENMLVHARLLGLGAGVVPQTLAVVGLADTGRKAVRSFSTGMKARLALAIALIADPPLLALDEPQNGLDPEGVIELRRLLRDLAARGHTVLISSHQLGEVAHLADDIGVLSHGRMVYEGPIRDFTAGGDLEGAYLAATEEAMR